MTSYIEQINAQIAALQDEIAKLEIAKDVIARLDQRSQKTLTLKANPEKKSGAITIRKVEGKYSPVKEEKTKRGGARTAPVKGITEHYAKRATAVLTVHDGLKTGEIAEKMGLTEQPDKQRLYSVMNKLVTDGRVDKDGDLRHWLIHKQTSTPESEQPPEQPPETTPEQENA